MPAWHAVRVTEVLTADPTTRRGSNLPRVGDYNQVVVLEAIRRHAVGLSRVEISAATGLSAQTVSNITRRLIQQGLVVEAGKQIVGPGKPRRLLRLAADGRYAIGVHVDPAIITFVVLDLVGNVVARSDRPFPSDAQPDRVLHGIAGEVDALIGTSGVPRDRVVGLGVATPGPVDSAVGAVVHPPNLPLWERVPVRAALWEATGLPVHLDKDVVAAAAAESWAGGVAGTGGCLFVYLGAGVGAGLVLGGEVFRGSSGNAGEIGRMRTGPGGPPCTCGPDCVDEVFAVRCLVLAAEAAGLGRWPEADAPALDRAITEVCRLAAEGSAEALRLVDGCAERVATAVCGIVDLLDLEQVVFGGPVWARLGPRFLHVVPAVLERLSVAASIHPVAVGGTRVGADVAAVGAACLVLDHAFSPRSTTLLLQS